jgi:gentisate 1,2-dioxygenase
MDEAPKLTNARADFYARLSERSMAPLWQVLKGLITPEPRSPALPALWRYDEIRPYILEAGELITAKEAERRVLILENPGMKGSSAITRTLYAGLQLILPGEVAPAHRHSQTALRFVVEGEGAYTAVEGERTTMRPGDFVITPTWTWHDHGNGSDRPMVWMDGLDIPLVQFLDASFAERGEEDSQNVARPEGDALARYGQGLLPIDHDARQPSSPIFNYPYARTREALEVMRRSGPWDPHHGLKMKYVNPATGGWAIPTMATCMQLLPKGFDGAAYRSTDGAVFCCVEGRGHTEMGGERFDWGPRDIFVVPSWTEHRHVAAGEAVLFSFSDRPVQEALGLWRERRAA